MFVKHLSDCEEIVAGDSSILRELFNPLKQAMELNYSLAHAKVKPGGATYNHKLKSSEVYYILQGKGKLHVNDKEVKVKKNQTAYIPPNSEQWIENTGNENLVFLCIVEPAWKAEDEEVLEG